MFAVTHADEDRLREGRALSATDLELRRILTSGGDDRIELIPETGLNKYWLDPLQFDGILNRGSCTCSTLNPESYRHLVNFHDQAQAQDVANMRRAHRQRIKRLLNFPGEDLFEVIFAPSGSDLTYLPLLFARGVYGRRKILNLVSCPEELGSGSIKGTQGQLFMRKNQFGEPVTHGKQIVDGEIETRFFSARDASGRIADHRQALMEVLKERGSTKILHLVYGSKSGIEDNLELIDHVDDQSLVVVDMCQFRNRLKLTNRLLQKGCCVMITGSKFYQSPPFCGAMLVPHALLQRLQPQEVRDSGIDLAKIFSQHDVSHDLVELIPSLRPYNNMGLTYRWECALFEMEKINQLGAETIDQAISEWNSLVVEFMKKSSWFELMPQQEQTNSTIISFQVRSRDGTFLADERLRTFYRSAVLQEIGDDFKYMYVGQPVCYGARSFLRLAIGSYDLRKEILRNFSFQQDAQLLLHLEKHASTFS
ncbi:MAG: hypothetical protein KTR24_13860 [Saprospiraceae bacterium]|nr:hypothetical protein [Saprospiraceae bacterium]